MLLTTSPKSIKPPNKGIAYHACLKGQVLARPACTQKSHKGNQQSNQQNVCVESYTIYIGKMNSQKYRLAVKLLTLSPMAGKNKVSQ